MRFWNKIVSFIKSIFIKQDKPKELVEPMKIYNIAEKRNDFISKIKIGNKEVETLTCVGDGLGIQKRISY